MADKRMSCLDRAAASALFSILPAVLAAGLAALLLAGCGGGSDASGDADAVADTPDAADGAGDDGVQGDLPDGGSEDLPGDDASGSGDDPAPDPCSGIECSGHGVCVVDSGTPACRCLPGYRVEGLACLPEYVELCGSDLCLSGAPYVAKGTNYDGRTGVYPYITDGEGRENWNPYQIFHDFDEAVIRSDLEFLRRELGMTSFRIFTPSLLDFEPFVTYHSFEPWFFEDGAINPTYLERIVILLDTALELDIHVHLSLLANFQREFEGAELIPPGSPRELFYTTYMESLLMPLADHPAIMALEVGNETLINADINYWAHSYYEEQVLSFVARMAQAIRRADSNHLLTSGEVVPPPVAPYTTAWHWPTPELAPINDVHNLNGGAPFTLASVVDYLSPHFYQQTQDLAPSMAAIREHTDLPVVAGEIGYAVSDKFIVDKDIYAADQEAYFVAAAQAICVSNFSGMLPWSALPQFELIPGSYTKVPIDHPYCPVGIQMTDPVPRLIICYDDTWELFRYDLTPLPAAIVVRDLACP